MDNLLIENGVVVDNLGIDCLADYRQYKIRDVKAYSLFVITDAYTKRPDLLAFDLYGDQNLWWTIMVYNGLVSYSDFRTGVLIKIPSAKEMRDALTVDEIVQYSQVQI